MAKYYKQGISTQKISPEQKAKLQYIKQWCPQDPALLLQQIMSFNSVKDAVILCLTKMIRMFAYAIFAVKLADLLYYKDHQEVSEQPLPLIQAVAVAGSLTITLLLASRHYPRRYTLMLASLLMVIGGLLFISAQNTWLLLLGGCVGLASATGFETGPFLALQRASLVQLIVRPAQGTNQSSVVVVHSLLGYICQALGLYFAVWYKPSVPQQCDYFWGSYEDEMLLYAVLGVFLFLLYCSLSESIEVDRAQGKRRKLRLQVLPRKKHELALCGLIAFKSCAEALLSIPYLVYLFTMRYQIQSTFQAEYYLWVYPLACALGYLFATKVFGSRIQQSVGTKKSYVTGSRILTSVKIVSTALLILSFFQEKDRIDNLVLLCSYAFLVQLEQPAEKQLIRKLLPSAQNSTTKKPMLVFASSVGLIAGLLLNYLPMSLRPYNSVINVPFLLAGCGRVFYQLMFGRLWWWGERRGHEQAKPLSSVEIVELK